MTGEKPKTQKPKPAQAREDRLKAALKQNMARRKAQAKARAAQTTDAGSEQTDKSAQPPARNDT